MQGTDARGLITQPAGDLVVQGQDQVPQAGQTGTVQQQGGQNDRLRLQPVDQPQAGVRKGVFSPKDSHSGHAVDATGSVASSATNH